MSRRRIALLTRERIRRQEKSRMYGWPAKAGAHSFVRECFGWSGLAALSCRIARSGRVRFRAARRNDRHNHGWNDSKNPQGDCRAFAKVTAGLGYVLDHIPADV